jgi:hypothetical protein
MKHRSFYAFITIHVTCYPYPDSDFNILRKTEGGIGRHDDANNLFSQFCERV